MTNNITILIIGLSLFFTMNLPAQENKVKEKKPDATTTQTETIKEESTENPPKDQLIETKKIQTVDKSGKVQNVTVMEYF
ncbi:MAG: hypothetical protein NTY22_06130 [Proteobacteria bacterium]|nr:hypothetical protein [Pseudomonadota bacterium]